MAVKGKKVKVASRQAAKVVVSAKKKVTSRSKPVAAAKGKKVTSRTASVAAVREKKMIPQSKPAVVPVKEKQFKSKITSGGAMKPTKMPIVKRIQTAEGWRRAQLRALQARKQKGAKK